MTQTNTASGRQRASFQYTRNRKDEIGMTDFEQIHQLKLSLIEKGWDIEEKYSNDGFGNLVGYTIFARRCDWHSKFTYALTGHVISFCGICTTISDSQAMLATVQKLHDKCIQAWTDFPDQIPFQTARNEIKADIIFQPFETAREYHVNDNRYFK